jgi:hypothetical protein
MEVEMGLLSSSKFSLSQLTGWARQAQQSGDRSTAPENIQPAGLVAARSEGPTENRGINLEELLIRQHGKVIDHYRDLLTRGGLSATEVQRVESGVNSAQAELDRLLSTVLAKPAV